MTCVKSRSSPLLCFFGWLGGWLFGLCRINPVHVLPPTCKTSLIISPIYACIFRVVVLYSLKIFRSTFCSHFIFHVPPSSLLTSSFILSFLYLNNIYNYAAPQISSASCHFLPAGLNRRLTYRRCN